MFRIVVPGRKTAPFTTIPFSRSRCGMTAPKKGARCKTSCQLSGSKDGLQDAVVEDVAVERVLKIHAT